MLFYRKWLYNTHPYVTKSRKVKIVKDHFNTFLALDGCLFEGSAHLKNIFFKGGAYLRVVHSFEEIRYVVILKWCLHLMR